MLKTNKTTITRRKSLFFAVISNDAINNHAGAKYSVMTWNAKTARDSFVKEQSNQAIICAKKDISTWLPLPKSPNRVVFAIQPSTKIALKASGVPTTTPYIGQVIVVDAKDQTFRRLNTRKLASNTPKVV